MHGGNTVRRRMARTTLTHNGLGWFKNSWGWSMFPENERPVVEPKTSLLYIIEKEDDSFNNPNLHVFGGGCSKLLNFRGVVASWDVEKTFRNHMEDLGTGSEVTCCVFFRGWQFFTRGTTKTCKTNIEDELISLLKMISMLNRYEVFGWMIHIATLIGDLSQSFISGWWLVIYHELSAWSLSPFACVVSCSHLCTEFARWASYVICRLRDLGYFQWCQACQFWMEKWGTPPNSVYHVYWRSKQILYFFLP